MSRLPSKVSTSHLPSPCEEDVKSDESSVEFRQLSNDSNRNVLESSNDTTGLNTSGEVGFASFESSPKLLPIDKDVNSGHDVRVSETRQR